MKIVIGITQDPENIENYIDQYAGKVGSATEVGPFLSQEEARVWQESLKNKISTIEVVPEEPNIQLDAVFYGFTFESGG